MHTPSVLNRNYPELPLRHAASTRTHLDESELYDEHIWFVDEHNKTHPDDMDFQSPSMAKHLSSRQSRNHLRISTHTVSDLHDRYLSSEEEPSPSPNSDRAESDAQELHTPPADTVETYVDEADEAPAAEEFKAEIAIAVPILAMGRPKLVDITNLAPMHKRKRSAEQTMLRATTKHMITRKAVGTDENAASLAHVATKIDMSRVQSSNLEESQPDLAPETWFPEDHVHIVKDDDDVYLPELELRRPPSYRDYDPFSLDPPRLSPRGSCSAPPKKKGSVARARKASLPPTAMDNNPGWKNLGRSLSLAKRQEAQHPRGASKKPKMLARAANERVDTPSIPAFPN